jgi:hypothetical protein
VQAGTPTASDVVRDAARPDTIGISPPAARRDATAVAPPNAAPLPPTDTVPISTRDAELQAIREEIARRSARLDSMGRAINSLYVAPRPLPPAAPRPVPPSSAPSSR